MKNMYFAVMCVFAFVSWTVTFSVLGHFVYHHTESQDVTAALCTQWYQDALRESLRFGPAGEELYMLCIEVHELCLSEPEKTYQIEKLDTEDTEDLGSL